MTIGSKEVFDNNMIAVPYDAELLWLGGAENAYCQLNAQVTAQTGFKIAFERIKDDTSDVVAFGARNNSATGNNGRWFVGGWKNGSNKQWYFGYSVRHDYGTMRMNELVELELNFMNSRKARFNGADVVNLASSSNAEGLQLMFPVYVASNGNINTTYSSYYRYYSFVLSEGTDILFDIIPVRVGSVGYFYDKVSKKILAMSGSANFIVGPDKN